MRNICSEKLILYLSSSPDQYHKMLAWFILVEDKPDSGQLWEGHHESMGLDQLILFRRCYRAGSILRS